MNFEDHEQHGKLLERTKDNEIYEMMFNSGKMQGNLFTFQTIFSDS